MERILIVHNSYQHPGGEDSVVEAERRMLTSRGHEVRVFLKTYTDLQNTPRWRVPLQSVWSRKTAAELRRNINEFRPDVVHFHNTFPLVSAGAYWTVCNAGIPVVQTLHNFRWLCSGAILYRNGRVCEDCIGKFPWRGALHGCYRNSRIQTIASLMSLGVHRMLGTLKSRVTLFIALNQFCRDKFIEGGLPSGKFRIKPNFLDGEPTVAQVPGTGGLFVGRLSKEKGIDVLAVAAAGLPPDSLKVIGGGDLEPLVREKFGDAFLGYLSLEEILSQMRKASFLVIPSTCHENFPRTIVEAFASGIPVIASRIGAMAEIVEDQVTGLLFEPGNAVDLATKLRWALDHPLEMAVMGKNARMKYQEKYTADINYNMLLEIYREAVFLFNAGKQPLSAAGVA